MPDEVQHYHHTVPTISVDLKVAHTTRGDTWEIEVKGATDGKAAVAEFLATRGELEPHLTAPEGGKEK